MNGTESVEILKAPSTPPPLLRSPCTKRKREGKKEGKRENRRHGRGRAGVVIQIPEEAYWYAMVLFSFLSFPSLGVLRGKEDGKGGVNKQNVGRPGIYINETNIWDPFICCLCAVLIFHAIQP